MRDLITKVNANNREFPDPISPTYTSLRVHADGGVKINVQTLPFDICGLSFPSPTPIPSFPARPHANTMLASL